MIDPELGLDAVRTVAIRDGEIIAVTANAVAGMDTLDARGLVVTAGFIDLHSHAQDSAAYLAMVLGGTTTAFVLEKGTGDVDGWYAARAGRAAVHHGVAVGNAAVRTRVLGDLAGARGTAPTTEAANRAAIDAELSAIRAAIDAEMRRGAVAVGLLLGHTPGASPWEVLQVFRTAATHRATVHMHVRIFDERYWYLELSELIAAAASTGAAAHLVHINSSMQEDAPRALDLLRVARARGVDVSTEAYPYATAITGIKSSMFDGWATWPDAKFARYEWPITGERLTRMAFEQHRRTGGNVIIHPADSSAGEAWVRAALADTLTIIASDGILADGRGHPRTVSSPARVLGRCVREQKTLALTDAIRRLTLMPARRPAVRVPAMRRKGRVQVGMDADLVVFDPATVRDVGTVRDPSKAPEGVPHVLVGGIAVVRRGALAPGKLRGRAVRAPLEKSQHPESEPIRSLRAFQRALAAGCGATSGVGFFACGELASRSAKVSQMGMPTDLPEGVPVERVIRKRGGGTGVRSAKGIGSRRCARLHALLTISVTDSFACAARLTRSLHLRWSERVRRNERASSSCVSTVRQTLEGTRA